VHLGSHEIKGALDIFLFFFAFIKLFLLMINILSEELILKIIKDLNSASDVAKCRLVCKGWNRIAEPVMLGKEVIIRSEEGALSLYAHLYSKPAFGKLIKQLTFEEDYLPVALLKGLLHFAFTPNMEYMTGSVSTDQLYILINTIADKSPAKFLKLKTIPHPDSFSNVYNNSLITFKDTLQDLVFHVEDVEEDDIWDMANQLETFKCLTKLTLSGPLLTVFNLEDILNGCSHLEELTVNIKLQINILGKIEVDAWSATNVKILDSVKKIFIRRECRCDLLEYLLFKYPKIETIEIDVLLTPLVTARNNLQRILNVIKKIHSSKVKLLFKEQDLADSLKYIMADGTRFTISDVSSSEFSIIINRP
jgi:hypothetical protein